MFLEIIQVQGSSWFPLLATNLLHHPLLIEIQEIYIETHY